jgi:TRAP-type C4-dicarboxylate transport system permease small subunit
MLLGTACLTVLIVTTFLGAIMRYFFNNPFIWMEEVQIWMIIWAIFCGAGYAFRYGSHVSIEVLVDTFPRKVQVVVEWFGFICTWAVLIFVTYYGFKLNTLFIEMSKTTAILKIPSNKIYWIVPVGCIWMMISSAYYMVKKYFLHDNLKKGESA